MLSLTLYVSALTPGAWLLVKGLRALLDEVCADDYELLVRDVPDHPDEAYDDRVFATPTLLKRAPTPVAQITGDLTNRERVLRWLGLHADPLGQAAPAGDC